MNQNTAIQIVEKVGGTYKLNTDALTRILQQKNVLNKKVAVVTVAGAFRKGKSFFLSNCVRYLQSQNDGTDWMSPTASVSGFSWRRSINAVTEGILLWPEPFIVKDAKGEEIAILLMDTEGAFDHKSSMAQCATVFALAALLSSILVYNVMQDVQEDTLQHLQFFAQYGSYALDEADSNSPFQSLLFLIRDWQNGDDFGLEAGRKHLDYMLKFHASTNEDMRALRNDLQRSFVDMKCALLPSPGSKICRGSEGDVTVNDMDPEFKEELHKFIPYLLDTLTLPKEIGRKQITGAEFLAFFDAYAKIFASGKVPEPKSIFDATAEATHQSALSSSLDLYGNIMRTNFSQLADRSKYFEEAKLQSIHQKAMSAALNLFTETKKMGSLPQFLSSLKQKIEELFREVYLKDNQNRITVERSRKEKEEADRMRIEQEKRAREAQARQEQMRIQMEREKKEKEEAERKRIEEARRHKEEMERVQKEREEAERRRLEEQRREKEERERREQEMERQREREREHERREREAEMEKVRKQMEQMRLESERQQREAREREERREAESRRQLERERERREQAEREAAQRSYYNQPMPSMFMSPSNYGCQDSFSPSYSNASRSGTPSGRSPGRPRGSVMERYEQGIMPREGTRDYNRLQRDGFL